MKRISRLNFVLLLLVVLLFGLCGVRAYVYHRIAAYPGIKSFGAIEFGVKEGGYSPQLRIRDVVVNRPWVQGRIDQVKVDLEIMDSTEVIMLAGGNLQVNLDHRVEGAKDNSGKIPRVLGLNGSITKAGRRAEFTGLNSSGSDLCAVEVTASYGPWSGVLRDVCLTAKTFSGGHATHRQYPGTPLSLGAGSFTLDGALMVSSVTTEYGSAEEVSMTSETINAKSVVLLGMTFKTVAVILGDRWAISVGDVYVSVTKDLREIRGAGDCSAWFEALPAELRVPVMSGLRFSGRVNFSVNFESGTLDVDNSCRLVSPCSSLADLRKSFRYFPLGSGKEVITGPRTRGWVRYRSLSPYLIEAATTLEDPGFFQHRGFSVGALKAAMKANAGAGRTRLGGSTISQQTAKNLWLSPERTPGRKVQEAFLTVTLEACLTKEQILETYFNIVEYGPDLYGIGKAAKTLLNTSPGKLTQEEAFFLVRRLPNPKRALGAHEGGLLNTRKLLKNLAKSGKVHLDSDWVE